ncbi:MAG: GtrA family protein [Clostridia bacterium]|nr:GtrA family protein [Clostridia bacterium]
MKKIIELMKKHRQIILYLIFGVLTTLINIVAYWLFAHPLSLGTLASTVLAWLTSVFFAFFTNKSIVFESRGKKRFLFELFTFLASRVLTGVIDLAIMFVFVDVLLLNDMVIKIVSNIIVIVLNYVLSKFIVFRKKSEDKERK